MDEQEIENLVAELPALSRVGKFVQSLGAIPWFANLGEPLTAGAEAAAQCFADGLGFPDADVAVLVDWDDAAAAAESVDWNTPSWEAEELLRADAARRALDVLSDEALSFALTAAADAVSDSTREAVMEAASLWDVNDESVRNLAVGAAVQASHQALLAIIAGGEDASEFAAHPFMAKFQLFQFGRWPVGLTGRTLNLF